MYGLRSAHKLGRLSKEMHWSQIPFSRRSCCRYLDGFESVCRIYLRTGLCPGHEYLQTTDERKTVGMGSLVGKNIICELVKKIPRNDSDGQHLWTSLFRCFQTLMLWFPRNGSVMQLSLRAYSCGLVSGLRTIMINDLINLPSNTFGK